MIAKIACLGILSLFLIGSVADVLEPLEVDMALENSIFLTSKARDRLMEIYDERLAEWPIPYDELDLQTSYGTVHVIASGPEDGDPILLLHVSGGSATSWSRNIGILSQYRTYAIDHIGEANKSRLADVKVFPKTSDEITSLYAEISDLLNVERSIIIAGSNGGYIGMSYAIRYPERVSQLILTGPMGLTPPPIQMGLRLLAAQFIHLKSVEQGTLHWVLGSSPHVLEPYGEWFITMMQGTIPRVVPPKGIPAEQLSSIEIPVLLILGTTDHLVGPASRAENAASVMPNLRVIVLETSHFVNVEVAEEVNRHIQAFLGL